MAPRGRWSRLGGAASVGWGLLVWVFGEAFGGIFAPGLTWLFGAPGAVLFYCVAGLLVALPERAFSTPRLGRIVLGAGGVFLIGMALLQAWPGRGYWQGRGGTLHGHGRRRWRRRHSPASSRRGWRRSARFDDAHGWAVNLFAVVALATIGGLLISGRRRARPRCGLVALVVLCLADWVLVEDLGFFGGVGTDPELHAADGAALRRGVRGRHGAGCPTPRAQDDGAGANANAWPTGPPSGAWWERARPSPTCALVRRPRGSGRRGRSGQAPMAMAAVNPNADPILSEALDGTPNTLDSPAPPFALTDQHGRPVSLASLRGPRRWR